MTKIEHHIMQDLQNKIGYDVVTAAGRVLSLVDEPGCRVALLIQAISTMLELGATPIMMIGEPSPRERRTAIFMIALICAHVQDQDATSSAELHRKAIADLRRLGMIE